MRFVEDDDLGRGPGIEAPCPVGRPARFVAPSIPPLASYAQLSAWLFLERDTGVEPATFSLGNIRETVPDRIKGSQAVGTIQIETRSVSSESPTLAPNSSQFVSPVCPPKTTLLLNGAGSTKAVETVERMLSVRDVAERLGVRPVTVYRLCAKGKLEHVRVLNAIRVGKDAIQVFLVGSTKPRRTG